MMTPEESQQLERASYQGQLHGLAMMCGVIFNRLGYSKELHDDLNNLVEFAERAVREYPKSKSTTEEWADAYLFARGTRNIFLQALASVKWFQREA